MSNAGKATDQYLRCIDPLWGTGVLLLRFSPIPSFATLSLLSICSLDRRIPPLRRHTSKAANNPGVLLASSRRTQETRHTAPSQTVSHTKMQKVAMKMSLLLVNQNNYLSRQKWKPC